MIVVVGAGVCGLAAAYELSRRGKHATVFERGEPFCFITLAQDRQLESFELVQKRLEADEALFGQYEAWRKRRDDFNKALFRREPEAVKAAWQRFYFRGELPEETGEAPAAHTNRRRLKPLKLAF